jgi:hypothetical protein
LGIVVFAMSCAGVDGPGSAVGEPARVDPVEPPRASEHPPEPAPVVEAERAPPEFSAALTKGFADACGSCHDSQLDTAKPEALAIFDLADPQWLVALPEARRACTLDRIGGNASVTAAAKTDLARIVADLREG